MRASDIQVHSIHGSLGDRVGGDNNLAYSSLGCITCYDMEGLWDSFGSEAEKFDLEIV